MPLKPYRRGAKWWARGTVDYNGRPITGYFRESTGSLTEAGARDWINERGQREIRRFLVGEERSLTFADAVMLYNADPLMARYLIPLVNELGQMPVVEIMPQTVKDLGRKLYPGNSTDMWRRWVVTPVRAVINNAHALGKCPPIVIRGYEKRERIAQDRARGKASRVERVPGSWDWLLQFRQHAGKYHSALALFMFMTGARVGQAIRMTPEDLNLQQNKVRIPDAKGHEARWISIPVELVVELANLPHKIPRGWDRKKSNLRVFGFASSCGPLKGWRTACKAAGIAYIAPHAAGRHGFGQEMKVRQAVDGKAVSHFGGWADTTLLERTYTHAEDVEGKIHDALRTGLVQAEIKTGLKLRKTGR